MSEEPIEDPQGEENPPVGGAGGVPIPKTRRSYGKLPGLSRRQTYHVIVAIPTIQLAICFLLFLVATTDLYKMSYRYVIEITGFSLLTGLYQWYMAKFSGSCIGAMISVYTLILLNIVNILHWAFNFNYFLYGTILAGAGFLFSIPFFRGSRKRKK